MDDSLESIGVRRVGRSDYLSLSGPHREIWKPQQNSENGQQISVEILSGGKPWGQLEVAFKSFEESHGGLLGIAFPYGLIAFVGASSSLISWYFLSKTFKYLNPSKVVPNRVRSALDTLAEGLVLIDKSGDIAHANESFISLVNSSERQILGTKLDSFGWTKDKNAGIGAMPWDQCLSLIHI